MTDRTMRISPPFLFLLAFAFCSGTVAWSQAKSSAQDKQRGKETAVLDTDFGKIEMELFRKDAPKTVRNFVELARKGYFDRIKIHRISKDFVLQTGDPTGTGSGGQSIYGKPFEDEITGNRQFSKKKYTKAPRGGGEWFIYARGIVAMANLGRPATNTSQFFIILKDTEMPPSYTIFGRVSKGMDVVDNISKSPIIPVMGPTDGKPKKDIHIRSVTIR